MAIRLIIALQWRFMAVRQGVIDPFNLAVRTFVSRLYCPVCESKVPYFRPIPQYYQDMKDKYDIPDHHSETCNKNAYLCPKCGASDRSRLYALYLTNWLKQQPKDIDFTFLEFAPCSALQRYAKRTIPAYFKGCRLLTGDLMMDGVDYKLDICSMPQIKDLSVDFLICSHVLEHVVDDRAAMRELYRILKVGGKGILMVPIFLDIDVIDEDPSVTDIGTRWRRFGQNDHVRRYSKDGFMDRLQDAGFRIEPLGVDCFGSIVFRRAGISSTSVLYVVHKDA